MNSIQPTDPILLSTPRSKLHIDLKIPNTPSKKCKYSPGLIVEDITPSKRFRLYQARFKTSSKNIKAQTLSSIDKKKSR